MSATPHLASMAHLTYRPDLPQAIYMPEEHWLAARKEMQQSLLKVYGCDIPFVSREFTDAGVPHFLFRMIPVVPL